MELLRTLLEQTFLITLSVFVMMIGVDYFNVASHGKLSNFLKDSRYRQYFVGSFLGGTPGCVGPFMNVSFYTHGLLSFGAIVAGMLSAVGDEGFVMLALFPKAALVLMGILFVTGVGIGILTDFVIRRFNLKAQNACLLSEIHTHEAPAFSGFSGIVNELKQASLIRLILVLVCAGSLVAVTSGIIGPDDWDWERIIVVILTATCLFILITVPKHYMEEHIWRHITKRHLWRVAVWTFAALTLVEIGLKHWHLEELAQNHLHWTFLVACLVGLIPQSGPHLIFVMLYAQGNIPFSILLANTIVQDGHGLLPLLSYSVKDSIILKCINLSIGLLLGGIVFAFGF